MEIVGKCGGGTGIFRRGVVTPVLRSKSDDTLGAKMILPYAEMYKYSWYHFAASYAARYFIPSHFLLSLYSFTLFILVSASVMSSPASILWGRPTLLYAANPRLALIFQMRYTSATFGINFPVTLLLKLVGKVGRV
jgi:hypothetical protein